MIIIGLMPDLTQSILINGKLVEYKFGASGATRLVYVDFCGGTFNPHFFHTLHPHAIIPSLPLPDGSRTFRARREGMLRVGRPDAGRTGRRGGGHHGSAGSTGFTRGWSPREPVESQPPGRVPLQAGRKAGEGRKSRNGPVADMVCWMCFIARGTPGADREASRQRSGSVPEPMPDAGSAVCPDRGRGNTGGEP